MEQLRFEGVEFARRLGPVSSLIQLWAKEIKAELERPSILSFEPRPDPILKLFDPPPRCGEYLWVGDEGYLSCHLAEGHSGNHYDVSERIEWNHR